MSPFPNFGFSNLTILFILISCSFSQDYEYDNENNTDYNQEIRFRVVNGIPAKLGDVPYQVRLFIESLKRMVLIK